MISFRVSLYKREIRKLFHTPDDKGKEETKDNILFSSIDKTKWEGLVSSRVINASPIFAVVRESFTTKENTKKEKAKNQKNETYCPKNIPKPVLIVYFKIILTMFLHLVLLSIFELSTIFSI